MWPWQHAAIGYLIFSMITLAQRREPPDGNELLVLLIATQLPDLIDKPLAWSFHLLPSGRSLGHSLLTATLCLAGVTIIARYYDCSRLVAPLAIGYLTHLITDLPLAVLRGEFEQATFILWPLLPAPTYDTEESIVASLQFPELSLWLVGQFVLFVGAIGWVVHTHTAN